MARINKSDYFKWIWDERRLRNEIALQTLIQILSIGDQARNKVWANDHQRSWKSIALTLTGIGWSTKRQPLIMRLVTVQAKYYEWPREMMVKGVWKLRRNHGSQSSSGQPIHKACRYFTISCIILAWSDQVWQQIYEWNSTGDFFINELY